jgi:hypothetical protein
MASGEDFGQAVSNIDRMSVAASAVMGLAGGLGGAKALTSQVKSMSNATKGKIGEHVARAGIAMRGEKIVEQAEQAKKVPGLGQVTGRGANSRPDFVVQDKSGNMKVVEAKFGSSNLTPAQKDLQNQLGSEGFRVSRTTYAEVGAVGGSVGSAAAGAASNCAMSAADPCKR